MNQEMKWMGEMLRKRRQDLNLSLKEVENSTSIRCSYIQAIEEGKINECISSVYAIGFIKQYASFLEIDVKQFVLEHPRVFQMREQPHEFSYGIGTLETRGNLTTRVKSFSKVFWILGLAVIGTIVYYVAKAMGAL